MGKIILLVIGIFVFTQSLIANDKQNLKTHFLNTIDEVIMVVKNKALSKDDRNANIVEILTPMFDFELMAKLSLGKAWKKLNKEDKVKFVKLYVERMKQSYSSKIDAYSDEKVKVTNIKQPKSNRIELVTDLVSKENKLEISYKYYKPKRAKYKKDDWLVYDVVILGVSILKTDKAQFREFLRTKTITELMDRLVKK